jgi:hypothetical protein
MARENYPDIITSGPAESAAVSLDNKNTRRLTKLRLKVGMLAGIAAVAGLAATAKSNPAEAASAYTPGIEDVGFTTSRMFNENLEEAETTAEQIQRMGGTVVRIFYPLNKGTAWQNYHTETCNALKAAYDHQLEPIITFLGYDENGLGYVPRTNKQIKQFITTAASILWTAASKKDSENPGGCVQGLKNYKFEGINEINYTTFNRSLDDQTPAQALANDARLSKAIKKEAAKPEIDVHVEFGEALSVGSHDVIGFLTRQGQTAKNLRIKNPYDFVDIHPYPKNPTDDPSITMTKLNEPLNQLIDTYFPGTERVWGEVGINTSNIPSIEANGYETGVPDNIAVSESTQTRYVTNILKTAAAQETPWITFYSVQDDGGGSMPSAGSFYVSGRPKGNQPAIRYQIGKYTGR